MTGVVIDHKYKRKVFDKKKAQKKKDLALLKTQFKLKND